jgi:hypothetical protein
MALSVPPSEAILGQATSEEDCPAAEAEESEEEDEEEDDKDKDKDEDEEKSDESGLPEFWEAESATADSST